MNVKTTAILLCTLLATTFAHDWLEGQKIHHFGRHSLDSKERKQKNFPEVEEHVFPKNFPDLEVVENVASPQNLETGQGGLHWATANASSGITVIVNGSVCLVLDTVHNKTGCFNGETGAAVIIDLNLQVGIYLAPGSQGTWNCSQKNITQFLSLLVTLDLIGVAFDVATASDTILQVIASVLIRLDCSAKAKIDVSLRVAIELLICISVDLIVLIVIHLNGILKLTEGLCIQLRADIVWLKILLCGIARICIEINLTISALVNLGLDLKLVILLSLQTGAEVFVHILLALSLCIDLSLLKNILNDLELLLKLIIDLGGGLKVSLDACIDVILHIILFVNAKITLSVLNHVLLKVSVLAGAVLDITIIVTALINIIVQQNTTYGNCKNLKTFSDFCHDLKDKKCKYGGVDISAIITILINVTVKTAIEIVVSILVIVSVIVDINLCVGTLFYDCLQLVNTSCGVFLLNKVFINLKISAQIAASTNIVKALLAGLSVLIATIVAGLLRSVILILQALTGIKIIFNDLDDAVIKCTGGSTSLKLALYTNVCAQILAQIKVYILIALNLSLNIILI